MFAWLQKAAAIMISTPFMPLTTVPSAAYFIARNPLEDASLVTSIPSQLTGYTALRPALTKYFLLAVSANLLPSSTLYTIYYIVLNVYIFCMIKC